MDNKEALFLQLINKHKGMLFKVCRIYQDDEADREDLMQEMVLQLWKAFDSFQGKSKITSWMYKVALNTAIVFYKQQKRRPDTSPMPEQIDDVEDDLYDNDKEVQMKLFYAALKQLGKIDKALIFLYMEDQPYQEIAHNLGISEGNARVRLNRAKIKIKEIINNMNHEYR
ncbi:RNA polymerase sigma factor [Mucilaginibacter sp. KACC 22063]|uniref:RNA polymerase sigma factor n=1 Tax=Mucilaginibacter sp. KACC 22063 TaxID=3025666 RepID=UPI002366999B|nr:sigma-70 family RNA polymerase sigma factor [Mucilaginibacter sp. KACC 22063]WDF56273.1 sigma-70 family RNA polymerase sigma factor [Mucilaginibacter sp. KACC 22063]